MKSHRSERTRAIVTRCALLGVVPVVFRSTHLLVVSLHLNAAYVYMQADDIESEFMRRTASRGLASSNPEHIQMHLVRMNHNTDLSFTFLCGLWSRPSC